MTLIMEKLSRYWQLRFVVVGAGIALIVYAVLLPDPENKSRDSSIQSVAAAPLTPSANHGGPQVLPMADATGPSFASASPSKLPWLGENQAAVSQLQLAAGMNEEVVLPVDTSESTGALRIAADKGDAVAQFLLGHAYESGFGVAKDMAETSYWYGLAAEARPATANTEPAVKDFAQAWDAYRKLAEQGDRNAELYLGLAYDLGQDVPRNAQEAARWYRKAAAQGSGSAASNLGVIYFNGDGVPKDDVEAASWFRSAANRGCASAQYSLGRLYFMGDGVSRNPTEAANWLEKAAVQGNAGAQKLLSLMYATGQGVAGSTPKAYMWINLASARDEQARDSREQIAKVMPSDEVAEGQRLTHEWLALHGTAR
jgi:TPR repeat protein